jgi:ketosteroid isomerase-like protein
MGDQAAIQRVLDLFWRHPGGDVENAAEIYHDDAVLEFPQSGERFEGRAGFTEWRSQYPVPREDFRWRLRRTTIRDDFAVVELSASYDRGENWLQGVQLLDFRDGRVARERIYVVEGWDAPDWRAPWRSATPADPPD